ncbi:hypothetical protein Tco_0572385 [Tanacetum coccineum]
MPRKSFHELANYLQEVMQDSLPSMVDSQVKEVTKTTVPVYVAEGLILERQKMQAKVAQMVDSSVRNLLSFAQGIRTIIMMMLILRGRIVQKGRRYLSMELMFLENLHLVKLMEVNQVRKFHKELVKEMSETIDEAKLHKVVDEMLRQRCTSGDEHQYHIDQMQNFLKNDIIDPKAHALSLVNQDLLYLKKGNSGYMKYVLSLHKFPVVIFPNDGIEERTSRWVDKCVNKFNPYARYSVEHWKNLHAKIFYIKRQKEPGNPIEEVYSNSKIVQVTETIGELGHEHKFVIKIIVRRANGGFSSITEPDYKNLNKNDIEDMYMLCVNDKVDDYAETGLLWSLSVFIKSIVIWDRVHDLQLGVKSYQQNANFTASTITFPGIKKKKMFSIVTEPIYGIIYKNSKKEKRVMGHQEIHKFCDATLKIVLEGLKSYINDVKHGYVTSFHLLFSLLSLE